jgi:hypothetical protein
MMGSLWIDVIYRFQCILRTLEHRNPMKKFRFLLSEATNPNCEIPKFASQRDPPNAYLGS